VLTSIGDASDRERLIEALQQLGDSITEAIAVITESTNQPLLLSIDEAMRVLAVGETRIKRLVYSGKIDSVKIGRRRLIPYDALQDYTKQLVAEQASA